MFDYKFLNLKTGDIVLCAGIGRISKAIEFSNTLRGTPSNLTHVGMIYNCGILPSLIFESTTLGIYGKKGVQTNNLKNYIKSYKGKIYIRQMSPSPKIKLAKDFIAEHKDDSYESGISGLLALLAAGLGGKSKLLIAIWKILGLQTPEPHCSELIAAFFNYCDYCNCDIHHMPPVEFREDGKFERSLFNAKLGPLMEIKT